MTWIAHLHAALTVDQRHGGLVLLIGIRR